MADLVRLRPSALARRDRHDGARRVEHLAFRLAGDLYAAPLALIREILRPPPLTPVPRAPRTVLGIVSVRGKLVTVFDLRRLLEVAESPPTGRTRILLVDTGTETIGVLVDEVLEVHRLTEGEIEPASAVLGPHAAEHVLGMARPGGTMIVLIDLKPLLTR